MSRLAWPASINLRLSLSNIHVDLTLRSAGVRLAMTVTGGIRELLLERTLATSTVELRVTKIVLERGLVSFYLPMRLQSRTLGLS